MIVLKPVIVAEKISKIYLMGQVTVKALNEASFQIYDNELVCILGPSGSKKIDLDCRLISYWAEFDNKY